MKKLTCAACAALVVAALSPAAMAQIDGTRSSAGDNYGAARAVQTVNTQFGDNASEWNAGYAEMTATDLKLMFTGNLEANFNKLEIFIDANDNVTSNILATAGNDGSGVMDGMTFDTAFTPDYHLIAPRAEDGGLNKFDIDFADLGASTFDSFVDIAGGVNDGFSVNTGAGALTSGIDVGYDNSNTAGIVGGTGAADQGAALAVETGLELGISLADLGSPTSPIKVMVLQNNQGHDFLSNQTLGGLPAGTDNLGADPSLLDFNNFAGNQFFAVPEPAALSVLGVFGLAVLSRRRK